MRLRRLLLGAALLAAGCSTPDLPALPVDPAGPGEPEPPPVKGMEVAPTDPDALSPGKDGDPILPGVALLDPALEWATTTATFGVRNDSGRDLPDLILSVIFAVGPAAGRPAVPRFESVEAPLRAGETGRYRVTLAAIKEGEAATSFRVVPGLLEALTAAGEGLPGTTFLGGLLECSSLDVDLTAARPQVGVRLAARGVDPADLPPLEAQLLLGRAGELRWTGPWILVPRDLRIRWNLDGAPGVAGCDLYLRVRGKR